jgi:hypothetical protein
MYQYFMHPENRIGLYDPLPRPASRIIWMLFVGGLLAIVVANL